MIDRGEIKKILSEDINRNIQFIYSLDQESFKCVKQVGKSFLFNNHGNSYTICSNDRGELEQILNFLPREKHRISNTEYWTAQYISRKRDIIKFIKAFRFVLPENIKTPELKYDVENLSYCNASLVNETWEHRGNTSLDYIRWRIDSGPSALIKLNGDPAAWGLLHGNYSIGFLYTKNKYRRMGFAHDVLISLVEKVRKSGIIPYLYVVTDNMRSLNLIKKTGFQENGIYSWMNIGNV